jgi:hypothetical protein
MVEKKMEKLILTAQRNEITEHFVYKKLSQSAMNPHNKSVCKKRDSGSKITLQMRGEEMKNQGCGFFLLGQSR